MRFQINEVQADGDWVPLTDHRVSDSLENIFTLIVGQNAVGKSRLLRKIVSNYIFPQVSRIKSSIISMNYYNNWYPKVINKENKNWNYGNYFEVGGNPPSFNPYLYGGHNFELDEVRVSSYSIPLPSTVIAVSTGRHDRFPSAANVKDKELMAEYRYIGTDQFSKNSISSSLISLLEGLLQGRQNLHKLSDIFEYLGFAPYLDVKLSLDKKQYSKLKDEERRELHNESNQPLLDFLMEEGSRFHNNYLPGGDFFDQLKTRSKAHIELDFWDHSLGMKHHTIFELIPFLKFGLIRISDITLISLRNKARLRLSQASSGQQCMLTIMLGIAGAIKNGALICIDEPEISLHPQW